MYFNQWIKGIPLYLNIYRLFKHQHEKFSRWNSQCWKFLFLKILGFDKIGGGRGESERHSHFLLLALTDVKFYLTFFTSTFLPTLFLHPLLKFFLTWEGGTGNAGRGWGDSECRSYWSLEDQYSLVIDTINAFWIYHS